MSHIVIDIGNTRIKTGKFFQNKLTETKVFEKIEDLLTYLLSENFTRALLSSVSKEIEHTLIERLNTSLQVSIFGDFNDLPFESRYTTQHTLGKDRIAAIVGGISLFPNIPMLIVDAGTCITYDFVDANQVHLGGGISPGLEMRFKSLQHQTSALPLVSLQNSDETDNPIGTSTHEAIRKGVLTGYLAEIRASITYFKSRFASGQVIFCGGDSSTIASSIQPDHIVEPNLVLIGINEAFS